MGRREVVVLAASILVTHFLFFVLNWPLPHIDLDFYTEPAFHLAWSGQLRAPALQHHDVSYVDGWYFYPPGYPLTLTAWLRMFGLSNPSILAFTLVCHAMTLLALWAVLRLRLGFGVLATALAMAPLFLVFTHGRPDQTSMMFGVLGWLLCPRRVGLAGLLLGFALLCSPAIGLSVAVPAGVAVAGATRRLGPVIALTVSTIGSFACYLAAVLYWQGAWGLAAIQFSTNAAIRGVELNQFPNLLTAYGIRFCLVPFALFTLLPMALVLARELRANGPRTRSDAITALAYLATVGSLFVLVKAQLLLWLHFMLPARPAVIAALCNGRTNRVNSLMAVLFAFGILASTVDWMKHDLVSAFLGSNRPEPLPILPASTLVATDSLYYPMLRGRYELISYEVMKINYWRRYLDRSKGDPWFAERYGYRRPQTPLYIVLSAATIERIGPPDDTTYELLSGTTDCSKLRLFGITTPSLAAPYALSVYRYRTQ